MHVGYRHWYCNGVLAVVYKFTLDVITTTVYGLSVLPEFLCPPTSFTFKQSLSCLTQAETGSNIHIKTKLWATLLHKNNFPFSL